MKLVPTSASRTFGRTVLKAKKNSPHIAFAAGLAGAIGTVYLACKATLDLDETLESLRLEVEQANRKAVKEIDRSDILTPEVIDEAERERVKEVSIVTFRGVVVVGKLYAPAIVLGGVSVALLAGSHVQMTRRNAALTAAFTAATKAFEDYRARVRAEVGEEKELELYRAMETVQITGPDGKKQLVKAVNPHGMSMYAIRFDENNPEWKNNAEFNRIFLNAQEQWANHRLQKYGHVFLNEVYENLGFEHTQPGAVVGWVLNSEDGDNYINFGMFEARNRDFLDELENTIWLDFNVDGIIWDKI